MKEFKMDLHIHTCLSPCADLEMLPALIVKRAKEQGLDVIGICDHNSAENVATVRKAGEKEGLKIIRGIEITSSEEVHILALFGDDFALWKMQNLVYESLLGENDEDFFGEQLIADESDRIIGVNKKLLIGATTRTVDKVIKSIHDLGGMAIAAHVDRGHYSIIGQLGFIPAGLSLDALELSADYESEKIEDYKNSGFPLVSFSDAHFLSDIGKAFTTFFIESASLSEITMAFGGVEGRKVSI